MKLLYLKYFNTAPGNFTWLPEQHKFVMTTFYPYQWDLNYRNPIVMNEMIYNMLNLANKGIDIIRIDASTIYLEGAWNKL